VLLAAVGETAFAGVALLAVDIGLDRTAVTVADVGDVGADGEDLHAEFVSGNPRVGEERHLAEVTGEVSATDADAMDADEGFARSGSEGFGDVETDPGQGLFELEGLHGEITEMGWGGLSTDCTDYTDDGFGRVGFRCLAICEICEICGPKKFDRTRWTGSVVFGEAFLVAEVLDGGEEGVDLGEEVGIDG
jgi:hypothetical protein